MEILLERHFIRIRGPVLSTRFCPIVWRTFQKYRSKNALGEYGLPEDAGIIFDADGCRVLNPTLEKKSDAMAASDRKMMMYAIKNGVGTIFRKSSLLDGGLD